MKKPIFKIFVNQELLNPNNIIIIDNFTEKYEYVLNFNEISELQIEFINKNPNDTIVHEDKIVEDMYIYIDKFKINTLNFLDKISKISKYIGEDKVEYFTNNYMSFKGKLTIKFIENPIFTHWLTSIS